MNRRTLFASLLGFLGINRVVADAKPVDLKFQPKAFDFSSPPYEIGDGWAVDWGDPQYEITNTDRQVRLLDDTPVIEPDYLAKYVPAKERVGNHGLA